MKKFISLLIITIILSIPVFAQDNTKVDPNVKYVIEKIEKGISAISEKLKAPTEHVYTVLIKQQKIMGWAEVCFASFFLLLTILFIVLHDVSSNDIWINLSLISAIIFIILLIFVTFDGIPRIVNSEYYALTEILSCIK